MNAIWMKSGLGDTVKAVMEAKTGRTEAELAGNPSNEVAGIEELAIELVGASGGKNAFIVGDYDADGVTSASILRLLFQELGINASFYIPRRVTDGYGVNERIIKEEMPDNADFVVTVDNGIAAREALDACGKAVYVIDHHLAPADGRLPDADAIIDPEADGSEGFTHYCAAGLCYKLAEKLHSLGMASEECLEKAAMLAAIGTVADVMPLIDENRTIVRKGIALLKEGKWPELKEAVDLKNVTAEDLAFTIGPMINAYGRMLDDGGQKALDLIFESLEGHSIEAVNSLMEMNRQRKQAQEEAFRETMQKVDEDMDPIFVKADCMPGLIGIVAGKIAEETGKPAFVAADTGDGLKGSARGVPGFHVKEWMDERKESFTKYGGHEGAAGFSMSEEQFLELSEGCKNGKARPSEPKTLLYDLEVSEKDLPEAYRQARKFEPLGNGCPKPVFKIKMELAQSRYGEFYRAMGTKNQHVKLNGDGFAAVGFGMAEKYREMGRPLSLEAIGTLSMNHYRGKEELQVQILDFRPAKARPKSSFAALISKRAAERSAL